MRQLLIRRLLISVPLVFVVTFLVFFLQSLAPGSAASTILGDSYTPQAGAELERELGLDKPLVLRYWDWLSGALRGDLGVSPISGLSVADEVLGRLAVTLSLIIGTATVVTVVGVLLGLFGAIRGGWLGKVVDVLSLIGFALPNFWLGLVLVAFFAVKLQLFPATGYVPLGEAPGGWVVSLALPVTALATYGIAVVAKQTRNAVLDLMAREFVSALRSHGVSERSIIFRHVLRNAAIPVVTVVGLIMVGLLNGTVLIEGVFAMPGLGGLAVQAATQRDAPMIQGVALLFTLVVVVVNLLVDVAYGWLNPKVRVA